MAETWVGVPGIKIITAKTTAESKDPPQRSLCLQEKALDAQPKSGAPHATPQNSISTLRAAASGDRRYACIKNDLAQKAKSCIGENNTQPIDPINQVCGRFIIE